MATTVNPVNNGHKPLSAGHHRFRRRVTASLNEVTINDGDKRSNRSIRLAKSISQLWNLTIEKPSLKKLLRRGGDWSSDDQVETELDLLEEVTINDGDSDNRSNRSVRLAKSISDLLSLTIETPSLRKLLRRIDDWNADAQAETELDLLDEVTINDGDTDNRSNRSVRLAKSISDLLNLTIETPSLRKLLRRDDCNVVAQAEAMLDTPTTSPKEDISTIWREIHGGSDWENLLDPLHPVVRREIIKYGEFAQATYDAFDFDSFSEYCGSCLFNRRKLFEKLGLRYHGYDVSRYIYAMSQYEIPRWLEKSYVSDTWSKDSNWMGYVAVSDDVESKRIGRRDIVVAWRGTVLPSEWYEDMQRDLEPLGHGEAKVERGFLSIYKSKRMSTRYNKTSASDQVTGEVKRLLKLYKEKGEEVSLTITGHSLGGALALLNAYEASIMFPTLPISVISFGAPRVGNIAFRDELHHNGVKTLRVTIKQDLVPRMPGIVFNETLQKFDDLTGSLEWVYHHVGAELKLDVRASPFLKRGSNFIGIHHPETYLHLVDGYVNSTLPFRPDAKRDVALVNKYCDMLVNELRIPPCWYQLANKGLVCNEYGRWVRPKRLDEDIPSPSEEDNYEL